MKKFLRKGFMSFMSPTNLKLSLFIFCLAFSVCLHFIHSLFIVIAYWLQYALKVCLQQKKNLKPILSILKFQPFLFHFCHTWCVCLANFVHKSFRQLMQNQYAQLLFSFSFDKRLDMFLTAMLLLFSPSTIINKLPCLLHFPLLSDLQATFLSVG